MASRKGKGNPANLGWYAKQRAVLKYDPDWYTPVNLLYHADKKQVRKEYSRLRAIANKRLARMGKTKYRNTKTYQNNAGYYPPLKELNETALAYRLAKLRDFITSKTSTVSGLREIEKKSLSTLQAHGYNFVTPENFIQFGDFMEEYRSQKLDALYDSGDAADTYSVVTKHALPAEKVEKDFMFWLENHDIAQDLVSSTGKSAGSASRLKERVKKSKTYKQRNPGSKKAKGRKR